MEKELTIEEIKEKMSDRWWRLNNLYYVKDENGNKVLFIPNEVQSYIHEHLWYFNIIPKARQLGVTTFFSIFYLDQILFSENKTAGIIAHRQEDMKKIFRNKIKFAWDNLHPWLKAYIGEPDTNSANEMVFPNGSSIFVSMTTRSGTVQYLHISEFGYICAKAPDKAEEIVSGAINSVHPGNMVSIESTAMGQEGRFYEFCMEAEQMRQEGRRLGKQNFKIFFFPWWIDKRYKDEEATFVINSEYQEYFENLKRKYNIVVSDAQKRWYIDKKRLNRDKMFAEYPSTLEEAFQVSVEGAYFTSEMRKVYRDNRIRPVPHDPMLSVDTWWDLGMNDFNVILFTQTKDEQIRFIDMYWNRGESLAHYFDVLKDKREKKGYRYNTHNFPHDLEVKDLTTGRSRKDALYKMGMYNIRVAPKTGNIQEDIDRVRLIFPKFIIDEEHCERLHQAMFNYRKDFDKKMGVFKDKPRHDENSHFVDPLRVISALWSPGRSYSLSEYDEEQMKGQSRNQAFFG